MIDNRQVHIRNLQQPLLQNPSSQPSSNNVSIIESSTNDTIRDMSPYLRNSKKLSLGLDLEASQALANSTQVPSLPTCEVEGCNLLALGGVCAYRICCSNGCGKQLCKEHTAVMEPDEVGLRNMVCTGCKEHASRVQIYWLIAIIVVPILLSLPAVFLYSMQADQV